MDAATDGDADVHLGRLLEECARPLIRRIVERRTRGAATVADAEDLVAETLAQLLKRLREIRRFRLRPIADLRAYVATAAHRRCDERLRRSYPARARLAKQIRYLFRRRADLTTWRAPSGRTLCAFREEGGGARNAAARTCSRGGMTLAATERLVYDALSRAAGPIPLETLIGDVARIAGETCAPVEVSLDDISFQLASREPTLEERLSLRDLWRDIRCLPPGQRAALMLNLRDPTARDPVSLIPLVHAATFAEIASMLNLSPSELASIWDEVPLDDQRIAALLGVTRRRVVKLRRLARERLRRRRSASGRTS